MYAPAEIVMGEWSDDETELLRRFAHEGMSATEIAHRLDRTRRAVSARAYRLGIRLGGQRPAPPRARAGAVRWSDQEVATLHRLAAGGATLATIARVLGRTRGAIAGKCHRLGIGVG